MASYGCDCDATMWARMSRDMQMPQVSGYSEELNAMVREVGTGGRGDVDDRSGVFADGE